jgi:hypothetical protein
LTISKPSGVVNDDVMIAVIGGKASTLSGWTLIGGAQPSGGEGSLGTVRVFYKKANGEGSSYNWTITQGSDCWGAIVAYRGCDLSTPVDTTHFDVAADSGTNLATGSVTASGTQWALAFASEYTFQGSGSATVNSYTTTGATQRSTAHSNDGASPNREEASYVICDSNGNVAAGATSQSITSAISTSAAIRGIILLNQGGISVSLGTDGVGHATAAALQPTVLIQTVQAADGAAAALEASVKVWPNADVADHTVAAAYAAARPMLPTAAGATVSGGNASTHLDANAHDATVVTDAQNVSGYYGAAVVRVYGVPGENRTYKVQR